MNSPLTSAGGGAAVRADGRRLTGSLSWGTGRALRQNGSPSSVARRTGLQASSATFRRCTTAPGDAILPLPARSGAPGTGGMAKTVPPVATGPHRPSERVPSGGRSFPEDPKEPRSAGCAGAVPGKVSGAFRRALPPVEVTDRQERGYAVRRACEGPVTGKSLGMTPRTGGGGHPVRGASEARQGTVTAEGAVPVGTAPSVRPPVGGHRVRRITSRATPGCTRRSPRPAAPCPPGRGRTPPRRSGRGPRPRARPGRAAAPPRRTRC